MRVNFKLFFTLLCLSFVLIGCSEKEVKPIKGSYLVGLTLATQSGGDVLARADTITKGTISPAKNGLEMPAWMIYHQNGKRILAHAYNKDNTSIGYEIKAGKLVEINRIKTDLGLYAFGNVDKDNIVAVGSTRSGYENRIIYKINLKDMAITGKQNTRIDERKSQGVVSFPNDVFYRDGKIFVSYYIMGSGVNGGVRAFTTPFSNQARIAVYSYPSLKFEKIITDDRTADLGCYLSGNTLFKDENDDLYAYSTANAGSGFIPVPTKPAGLLRIKKGATDFDKDYFLDFEKISNGYKINNVVYAGNGKAVVRMLKEPKFSNASDAKKYQWAAYNPGAKKPMLEFGVIDIYNKTFKKVTGISNDGGGWGIASLVKDKKVYVKVSHSTESAIYEIDPATATAKKGANIASSYAKSIFFIPEN